MDFDKYWSINKHCTVPTRIPHVHLPHAMPCLLLSCAVMATAMSCRHLSNEASAINTKHLVSCVSFAHSAKQNICTKHIYFFLLSNNKITDVIDT